MAASKRQREDPCYVCGHYHDYEGGERCATCGHVLQHAACATEEASAMPTQILPGFLYVGSYDHASRIELLKAMNISHVLSLVPGCQELYRNTLTYHTISSSPADFRECFQYIDRVRSEQQRVVVHCMTGVAKSPAVVVAYLMHLRSWTLKESFMWVKDRHQSTEISHVDAARLQQLEVEMFGTSSTGLGQPGAARAGKALTIGHREPDVVTAPSRHPAQRERSRLRDTAGAPTGSSGPFSLGWAQAAQPHAPLSPGASPSFSFASASARHRDFVFGASREPPLQQPDTGQAAMDV